MGDGGRPPEGLSFPSRGSRLAPAREQITVMKKVHFKSRNEQDVIISAVIYFPEGFDEGRKHPEAEIERRPLPGLRDLRAAAQDQLAAHRPR
jgi:hypothetical protein